MEREAQYTIGTTIAADDGPCGTLGRVVIDPITESSPTSWWIRPITTGRPGSCRRTSATRPARPTSCRSRFGYTNDEQALVWPSFAGGA